MIKVINMTFIYLAVILLAGCTSDSSNSNDQVTFLIQNKGSDTMVNLALAWAEAYQKVEPSISISVTGGGSGTGIAALINKTVDIANASRQIKDDEINTAKTNNIEPFETIVARDAIAIIVHPENPITQLTLQQVSDIYSGKINNWSELGGEDRPIVRLSRETNSGTHVYFLETVIRLDNKESQLLFDQRTLLLPSSEGITSEVSSNPNAIGYDGLGYVTDSVKVVAISGDSDGPYVLPSAKTVNAGTYPISRDLYVYTNGEPGGAIKTYLDWILSDEAQAIVTRLGFVPALP